MKYQQSLMNLSCADRRDVRTQFAALCWRVRRGEVQVLLVTSRRRRRWILPKGWPADGQTPAEAAEREAFEEAGVEGNASEFCVGLFSYVKEQEEGDLPCIVSVFPLKVKRVLKDWPEKKERRRRWLSLRKAAALADDSELQPILRGFQPPGLKA